MIRVYDTAKCSLCTGYYCWHWAHEGRGWRPIGPMYAGRHTCVPQPTSCCGTMNAVCAGQPLLPGSLSLQVPQASAVPVFSEAWGTLFPLPHPPISASTFAYPSRPVRVPPPPGSQCMCLHGRPMLSTRERKMQRGQHLATAFRDFAIYCSIWMIRRVDAWKPILWAMCCPHYEGMWGFHKAWVPLGCPEIVQGDPCLGNEQTDDDINKKQLHTWRSRVKNPWGQPL